MSQKAILLIGIQGSGKSTYAKELEDNNPNMKRATQDDIRFMLFSKHNYNEKFEENTRRFGYLVEDIYSTVVETILAQKLDLIIDETHHQKFNRTGMVRWLKKNYPGITVEAHYLHTDLEDALRNNKTRKPEQIVPESVVREFHQELLKGFGGSWDIWSITDTLMYEGFDNVVVKIG
jgi:predicted kinase